MQQHLLAAVLSIAAITAAAAEPASDPPKPLSWGELSRMPQPPAGTRLKYGEGPQQFGELRVPDGEGPFPVVVLIHGGCWQNAFDYVYITHLASWLTERGVATWTIEYRRLGDEGGGWPGTFTDVGSATDALRDIAKRNGRIDIDRVYAAGHSAGGQLALWLATRAALPESSELYVNDPLPIRGVLGLAAITDLAKYQVGPPKSCHASVEPLLGGTPEAVGARYAATSPIERLPLRVPQVFIHGEKDPIVSIESIRGYVGAASKAGDDAVLLALPSLGHFDVAVPLPTTEATLSEALRVLMR
jgi:acetyl esterase/lipase